MSAKGPTRFTKFLKSFVIPCCVVGCVAAFWGDTPLGGWGLLITGLLLRLSVVQYEQQSMDEQGNVAEPSRGVLDGNKVPGQEFEEESEFYLNLTTPHLNGNSGWETLAVRRSPQQYVRQVCYGGPPAFEGLWEFDIKGRNFVFHRLLDDHIEDIWDDRYEVVNGCVQENLIESRHVEGDKAFVVYLPEEKIANLKRQVQWHEANGAVRFFILSKINPHGSGWRYEVEKLKESVAKIAAKAEELGAILGEYGFYELPQEASDEKKVALEKLFSPAVLRERYRIRSIKDWLERDFIIGLLEPPTIEKDELVS